MNTPEKHRMKIAIATLGMTPSGARIMGGMTFEEAHEVVYRTPLAPRLEELIQEYGRYPSSPLSWELGKYGWKTPYELLCAIDPMKGIT